MNTVNRGAVLMLALSIMLTGCAPGVTVTRHSGPISPGDRILVDIVFDRIGLAPVFRSELRAAGFSVADTKSEAVYVLTGRYVPKWDLLRYILVSGEFAITELATGAVVMRLRTGPTHMASAETAVHKMVKDMLRENRKGGSAGPAQTIWEAAPARPSVTPGELKWPPVNSSFVMSVWTSGSFGSGSRLQTTYFLGEREWQGRTVFAFGDGSTTTYLDARRRTLARVKADAPVEVFEPYFLLADWPLSVGKRWPNRYRHYDYVSGRRFDDVQYGGTVEAHEDVKTPAGAFKAFRIHLSGTSSNFNLWYSGELGLFVRTRTERFSNHYLGSGVREAELVSYSFRP
jgi:hypothetical protein